MLPCGTKQQLNNTCRLGGVTDREAGLLTIVCYGFPRIGEV